jgi:hypothetical protein
MGVRGEQPCAAAAEFAKHYVEGNTSRESLQLSSKPGKQPSSLGDGMREVKSQRALGASIYAGQRPLLLCPVQL